VTPPDSIADFYRRAEAGGSFEGQLDDAFQSRLVEANAAVAKESCDFYHTMAWNDGEVTPGVWDLRGRERGYLGWVNVAGLRVLEFGPATGHLTFHMEKMGAEVVAFDLPPGMATDIIPQVGHDLDAHRRLNLEYMERVRNSWWYSRKRLGASARVVYGDIYRLPSDLPHCDVATFGSILMHLSRPFFALQQAAAVVNRAIIVTEPIPYVPRSTERADQEFAPIDTAKTVVVWWQLWPGTIIRMLHVLGFREFSVHYHVQQHHVHHELDKPAEESLLFTVVGERHKGFATRLERTEAEVLAERDVLRRYPPPGATEGPPPLHPATARLEAELAGLRSSFSWRLSWPVRALGSLLRRAGLR
jgi:SAM-dependent methyltransferase